jgi:glutaredoxin
MKAARHLLAACLLSTLVAPALAQYKWVGAGGTVTYSDLPPPAGISAQTLSKTGLVKRDEAALPSGLASAAGKYPVVLYTTRDCAPCQQARALLVKRGVPFTEKTVQTHADVETFKRIGFEQPAFPAMSVGRERTTGLQAEDWERLIDAAGYPKTASLPPGYRHPPAQSLAPRPAAKPIPEQAEAGMGAERSGEIESELKRTQPMPAVNLRPGPQTGVTSLRF